MQRQKAATAVGFAVISYLVQAIYHFWGSAHLSLRMARCGCMDKERTRSDMYVDAGEDWWDHGGCASCMSTPTSWAILGVLDGEDLIHDV
jgi:hypothetical protein